MTGRERELLRLAVSEKRRERLAMTLLGVTPEQRCSRCNKAVDKQDLSPGRYWCRPCESKRRLYHHRRKRAA
jgi:DNA-directed RNA polymerase subunit RPC12/RpoP